MFAHKLHTNIKNCTFFDFFAHKLHTKYLSINLRIVGLIQLFKQ